MNLNIFFASWIVNGKYFTKSSRGELIQSRFPITGVFSPVKDGALVTVNAVF